MRSGQRRFPRLRTNQKGEMEIRLRVNGRSQVVHIPVTVRSLAPEGAGLAVHARQYLPMTRGSAMKLHFLVDGQDFELPGQVAWSAAEQESDRFIDIGVRLHLELAQVHTRQAYATWIVSRLNAAQATG